jgi:hypothetical protein
MNSGYKMSDEKTRNNERKQQCGNNLQCGIGTSPTQTDVIVEAQSLLTPKRHPDAVLPADPDPYVFGHPGFRSGSFYHQAKIVRKTLIPTVL